MTFSDRDPIFGLEKLWLRATYRYEVLDDPLMPDGEWDKLTALLRTRWGELSPVFRSSVPFGCPASSTGSGIDWTKGAPLAVAEMEKPAEIREDMF